VVRSRVGAQRAWVEQANRLSAIHPRPVTSSVKRPTLESVTTINPDGSRPFLHPSDVKGRFTLFRRITGLLLIAVYILLPWIPINGHPAVFLDVAAGRFHLMGLTLLVQDVWLVFFVISGLGFSLFFVTALLGRIWCGWGCPYTVFLEHVFRRIERLIDGEAAARKQLDAAPWGLLKVLRRLVKHALYIACAGAIAHIFLSYFISLPALYGYMKEAPQKHWILFTGVMALTGVLYFCFAWFREQFCIVMCPYGRLQSALTDDDSMVIGYDRKRGEPRGKVSDPGAGHCIDCRRCVHVCPTGIDIRNGLQMECIGCAACVDACDDIMTKLKRPRGLVRYDSLNGLTGKKRRILRPRIFVYGVLMLLGAAAFAFGLTRVHSFELTVVRMRGLPFMVDHDVVRNQFLFRLVSKADQPVTYRLSIENAPPALAVSGLEKEVTVAPQQELQQTLLLTMKAADYTGEFKFRVAARPVGNDDVIYRETEFLGPDPRLFRESLTPPPSAQP
jgi:cytochrome c oxidase accessory protein FixG